MEFGYNRQGQTIKKPDQNETTHEFEYDGQGRLTADKVTNVGNGVDSYVSRIGRTYNTARWGGIYHQLRRRRRINVRNQVVFEYNDLGMPLTEYQERAGTKTSATLDVHVRLRNCGLGQRLPRACGRRA